MAMGMGILYMQDCRRLPLRASGTGFVMHQGICSERNEQKNLTEMYIRSHERPNVESQQLRN